MLITFVEWGRISKLSLTTNTSTYMRDECKEWRRFFIKIKMWLLHIFHLFDFDIKQRSFNSQKNCNISAGLLDVLELSENIIEPKYIMRDHELPNRVRSVYFVDNKGYFEQMINGRISFVLSRSINWSLCTIKTTFYSLSFCFLTTKKSF